MTTQEINYCLGIINKVLETEIVENVNTKEPILKVIFETNSKGFPLNHKREKNRFFYTLEEFLLFAVEEQYTITEKNEVTKDSNFAVIEFKVSFSNVVIASNDIISGLIGIYGIKDHRISLGKYPNTMPITIPFTVQTKQLKVFRFDLIPDNVKLHITSY